ncbi:MAG: hypothetical protein HQL53_07675, partial [Magnetococcales bacterium]|nr:hypothetical protein [Magnetococcales bacterium]
MPRLEQLAHFFPRIWTPPTLFILILMAISAQEYLLFHTLVELFTILVAMTLFVVIWHTYAFSRNHYFMALGCGYFWVGIIDMIHTLTYSGMGLITTASSYPAVQLWLVARFGEAFLLLLAPILFHTSLRRIRLFILMGAITILCIWMVFSGHFPEAYQKGIGLTPFKIYSEYIIIVILALSIIHLMLNRARMERDILRLMTIAIILTILAEAAFTTYISLYGSANMVGHIFKFFSFWLVFEAIIRTTLTEPYKILARDAGAYDAVQDPIIVVDDSGMIRQANQAAAGFAGCPKEELFGR